MSKALTLFAEFFEAGELDKALKAFKELSDSKQRDALLSLYQQCKQSSPPDFISVLYRDLHEGNAFSDFYESWYPNKEFCNPIDYAGQHYAQHFPAPVHVVNALNIKNPNEVISIGFVWTETEAQRQFFHEALESDKPGNRERRESIEKVADKRSVDIYELKTADNLGCPFEWRPTS